MHDGRRLESQPAPKQAWKRRSPSASFRFPLLFASAGTGKEMDHVVIVFVTRVFVDLLTGIRLDPGDAGGPVPRPCPRILHGKFVGQGVRIDAGEAFGDAE